jgi:RNA polymerase sigma-70 factor (ECF subfamily)
MGAARGVEGSGKSGTQPESDGDVQATMTAPAQDRELVLAARDGSEAAFRTLVERYHARLYETVLRIVKERADAEEVTQETFFRAWRNLKNFQFDSALYTWLYRIAVNAAVDLSARRRRRSHVSIDDENSHVASSIRGHEPPPAAGPERSEAIALVRAGVDELPEPFKTILILREYGDMSYDQLAEVLEVPKGTVESRLFRARMRLRDWLVEKLGEEEAKNLLPEEA